MTGQHPPIPAQRCSVLDGDPTRNRSLIKRYITDEQMLSVTPSSNLLLLSDTGGMDGGRVTWRDQGGQFAVWETKFTPRLLESAFRY